MEKKYLVHAGTVVSRNDGDKHFINARELMRLYQVDPRECVVCIACQARTLRGTSTDCDGSPRDFIDLFPKHSEDYSLPDKSSE